MNMKNYVEETLLWMDHEIDAKYINDDNMQRLEKALIKCILDTWKQPFPPDMIGSVLTDLSQLFSARTLTPVTDTEKDWEPVENEKDTYIHKRNRGLFKKKINDDRFFISNTDRFIVTDVTDKEETVKREPTDFESIFVKELFPITFPYHQICRGILAVMCVDQYEMMCVYSSECDRSNHKIFRVFDTSKDIWEEVPIQSVMDKFKDLV